MNHLGKIQFFSIFQSLCNQRIFSNISKQLYFLNHKSSRVEFFWDLFSIKYIYYLQLTADGNISSFHRLLFCLRILNISHKINRRIFIYTPKCRTNIYKRYVFIKKQSHKYSQFIQKRIIKRHLFENSLDI